MIKSFNFLTAQKILLSCAVIFSFTLYVVKVNQQRAIVRQQTEETQESSLVFSSSDITDEINQPLVWYQDGEYTGETIDATYGFIEVKIHIKDGLISQVELLQYPNHHDYSLLVNPMALPHLATETIKKQNAEVDGYSGATFTSNAFKRSLQSALDQAVI